MKPQDKETETTQKSPIFPSFSQHPWLFQLHGTKKHTLSFINPLNGSTEEMSIPEMQGKICLGCFGEWVLLYHRKSNGMSLLNLASVDEIELPAMPEPFESLGCFALSSTPTSPKCIIVTVGKGDNFILYSRPSKDQKWIKIRPILNVYYNGEVFINQGRIYAVLGWHRIAVIDLESVPTGVIIGGIMDMPNSSDYQNTHLVSSGDDVFLLLVRFSLSRLVVTDVDIYILDTPQLTSRKFQVLDGAVGDSNVFTPWIRAGSINRGVFLLGGDYSISLSANHAGAQCNCIYLLQPDEDGLRLYNICLDDQTTTSKVLLPEYYAWNNFYWVVPKRSRNIKRRTMKSSTTLISAGEKRTSDDVSISWTNVPSGIVQELLSFLALPDRVHLTSVCKSWNSFSEYVRDLKVFPWLMFSSNCGSLNFIDTFYGLECYMPMEWLGSYGKLTFHCSKDGWFIASDRNKSLFILNPLTREGIKLPPLRNYWISHMSFSFSSVPTNSNCIVLGVQANYSYCLLYTWRRGLDHWIEECIKFTDDDNDDPFCPELVGPVFFRDEFYILGTKGDFLVFNPTTEKHQFLDMLAPIHSEAVLDTRKEECYLLELDGELIYVFKSRTIETYSVYKLDRSKMVWMELKDLKGMTAFLSCGSSIMRPSMNRVYANGMLFPRIYGDGSKRPVFYSVQNDALQPKSEDTKEIMNCIWFEPNLLASKSKRIRKMFTIV